MEKHDDINNIIIIIIIIIIIKHHRHHHQQQHFVINFSVTKNEYFISWSKFMHYI
jgi:hypothetical protein